MQTIHFMETLYEGGEAQLNPSQPLLHLYRPVAGKLRDFVIFLFDVTFPQFF